MSKWEMVRLGDICKITSGGTPNRKKNEYYNNGNVPWVKTGDLKKKDLKQASEYITELGLKESSAKLFPQNTVLIALYGATIGNCSILKIKASTNQACGAILPNSKISPNYLYYFLLNNKNKFISQGVGGAQPNISGSILKNTKIPLPPLDKQIKIADALEKAESLISLKKEQIKYMDELIQSLFYDMFGDPVSNPKCWDVSELGLNLDSIDSGWSPKCLNSPADKENWGVLKLSAVTGNKYKESENKQLPIDVNPKESKEVKVNDLLFTRKNTIDLVGACAYVYTTRSKLMMPDIIFRLNTKDSLSKLYLWGLFTCKTFRSNITSLAGGSAASMLNISKAKLSALDIPVPPISLQNEFADKVIAIENKKEEMVKGLEELEVMFKSIMQKSFRGELF